ncbi:MAG: hypothetical protein ACLQGN_30835 [Mycobacterium sp.]|uniref:hypothetical protein n=1 Tax=Mycobacterium sp. TaxID=1785 RepID=UPI003F9A75B9
MKLFHKKPVYNIAEIKAARQRIRDIRDSAGDVNDKRAALDALKQEIKSDNVLKALIFEVLPDPRVAAGSKKPVD